MNGCNFEACILCPSNLPLIHKRFYFYLNGKSEVCQLREIILGNIAIWYVFIILDLGTKFCLIHFVFKKNHAINLQAVILHLHSNW